MASSVRYINTINDWVNFDERMIEIRKKYTYERDDRSKVLMIYALEDKAKLIDKNLFNTTFKKFKYISFKLSSLSVRMAAMYLNEIINVKLRFETLYYTKIDNVVMKDGVESNLEDLLRK